jgi:hypothetical protein
MKRFLLMALVLLACCRLGAQRVTLRKMVPLVADFLSGAEDALNKAIDLYNAGDYDACISLLDSMSRKQWSLTKQGRENVYALTAKAWIEKDNIPQAELAVKHMLLNNPNYELVEADNPDDFNKLVKQFDVHPLFSLGVKNTVLTPHLVTTKVYSILADVDYSVPYNTSKYYLMYYGWAEYEFKKQLSVNIDASYFFLSYSRHLSNRSNWDTYYNETLRIIETPICIKKYISILPYDVFFKNFLSYVATGINLTHLTISTASATNNYTEYNGGIPTYYTTSAREINTLPQRNSNSIGWLVAGGVGYKVKNLRLFVDFRYIGGLTSLTNSSTRLDNAVLVKQYGYIDNAIRLNQTELGASISYTFKNSVKKKKG